MYNEDESNLCWVLLTACSKHCSEAWERCSVLNRKDCHHCHENDPPWLIFNFEIIAILSPLSEVWAHSWVWASSHWRYTSLCRISTSGCPAQPQLFACSPKTINVMRIFENYQALCTLRRKFVRNLLHNITSFIFRLKFVNMLYNITNKNKKVTLRTVRRVAICSRFVDNNDFSFTTWEKTQCNDVGIALRDFWVFFWHWLDCWPDLEPQQGLLPGQRLLAPLQPSTTPS